MKSEAGWKWYGHAGHHICGERCQFHLATNIEDRFLVSTVGKFKPDPLRKPDRMETVGSGRYYETFVFKIDGDNKDGDPNILEYESIESDAYNESLEAEKGHYSMCRKMQAACDEKRRENEST